MTNKLWLTLLLLPSLCMGAPLVIQRPFQSEQFIPDALAKRIVIPIRPKIVADTPLIYTIQTALIPLSQKHAALLAQKTHYEVQFHLIGRHQHLALGNAKRLKAEELPGLTDRDIAYIHFIPIHFKYKKKQKVLHGDKDLGYILTFNMNGISRSLQVKLKRYAIDHLGELGQKIVPLKQSKQLSFTPRQKLVIFWETKLPTITHTSKEMVYILRPYIELIMITVKYCPGYFKAKEMQSTLLKKAINGGNK